MEYRGDREALDEFIGRQVVLVESAAIPKLLADVVELRLRHESVSRDEVRALWLGAGLIALGAPGSQQPSDVEHNEWTWSLFRVKASVADDGLS
jgi:hypothetical protein